MKCRVCKRALKNPKWAQIGIGPVCARRNGLTNSAPAALADGSVLLPEGGEDIVLRRIDGRAATNVAHQRKVHSPTCFEWGYGGSGPADLALNILLRFVGYERAWALHQAFKWHFVAAVPPEGGVIAASDIRAWLAQQRTEAAG